MDLTIRPAQPQDAAALSKLATEIFIDTFEAQNNPEDFQAYLKSAYGAEHQAREIADPQMITLLVEHQGQLIGYAQLEQKNVPECVEGPEPIRILRFYVHKTWHGRGVAQALMEACLRQARDRGARTIWLGVWEFNPRAISYYRKNGFVDVGSEVFHVGSDPQIDRIMTRSLD